MKKLFLLILVLLCAGMLLTFLPNFKSLENTSEPSIPTDAESISPAEGVSASVIIAQAPNGERDSSLSALSLETGTDSDVNETISKLILQKPIMHPTPDACIKAYAPLIADRHSALQTIRDAHGLEYRESYFSSDQDLISFDRYALADLNGDSFPELLLCSKGTGLVDLFTFQNQLLYLNYDRYFGFLPGTGDTVIRGHWHGAGGSGTDEWTVNSLSSGNTIAYFDRLGNSENQFYHFILPDQDIQWEMMDSPESAALYNEQVEKYVDVCVRMNDLPLYEIGDSRGLTKYVDIRELLPLRDVKQSCETAYGKFLYEKRYRIKGQDYSVEAPNWFGLADIDADTVPELFLSSGFGSGLKGLTYVYALNQCADDFTFYLGVNQFYFQAGNNVFGGYHDSRGEHYSELQLLPGLILTSSDLSEDAGKYLEQLPDFHTLQEPMDSFLHAYQEKRYNLSDQQNLEPSQKISGEHFSWLSSGYGFKLSDGYPAMGFMPKTLYKTTDDGQTWGAPIDLTDQIHNYPSSLFFWDELNGLILTDCRNAGDSIVYLTSDGGISWTPKIIDLSGRGYLGNYLRIDGIDAYFGSTTDTANRQFVNVQIALNAIYEDKDPQRFTMNLFEIPTDSTTASSAVNLPRITKNPTDETVPVSGRCQFVTRYENAELAEWHFVSPDETRDLNYLDIRNEFRTLTVINGNTKDMTLDTIPPGLNGWRVYCRFSNDSGSVNSGSALITVLPSATGGADTLSAVTGTNREKQIQVLMNNRDKWAYTENPWWYTFTDLDHNGRLEVHSVWIIGSSQITESRCYEVNQNCTGVESCISADSTVGLEYLDSLPCYYDSSSDKYFYLVNRYAQDGAMHQYYSPMVLSLQGGMIVWTKCGTKQIDYESFEAEKPKAVLTFRDVDGDIIPGMTEQEFDAAVENRFSGMEKSILKLEWVEG